MKIRRVLKEMSGLAERYCVRNGRKFRLEDTDPADTRGVKSRTHAEKLLEQSTAILNELQDKLYAQDRWALLLIFRARTSSTTTSSGGPTPRARSAAGSASSTARTTRRSW